jgi:poly [ADP-ribose] polymerase 2/3/4
LSVRLGMANWWRSDPPGTINPARLSGDAIVPPGTLLEASDTLFEASDNLLKAFEALFEASDAACPPVPSDTQDPPEAAQQCVPLKAPTPPRPRPGVPPLRRISSDWDVEHDIVALGNSRHDSVRKEFEESHVAKRRVAAARTRHTSLRGHFRSQMENGVRIHVPVDMSASPDATVVIDRATASIYDTYLLRADIMKNVNLFRRHQVCQQACTYIHENGVLTRCSSTDSIQSRAQNLHPLDPGRSRGP